MLSFPTPTVYQSPKCFVTYGKMSRLDPNQVPRKGKPWAQFLALDFIHQVDLILPGECFEIVHRKLVEERKTPEYARAAMRLEDVLERAFLTDYVKKGNIMMLSEGRTTVDRVYTLQEGILTLYLDKESYERAGLTGKPHGVKGKRQGKPRWIVTYDLRSPSMLHGKKGFDRLLYACKNALNDCLAWLICYVGNSARQPDPLEKHNPTTVSCMPSVARDVPTSIPPLAAPPSLPFAWDRTLLEEFATETYEWLSLVRLQSPRVRAHDEIDPYISTYLIPSGDSAAPDPVRAKAGPVCKLTWEGLFPASWLRGLLADTVASVPAGQWFSLSATTFARGTVGNVAEVAMLRPAGGQGEYIMWEIKSEE